MPKICKTSDCDKLATWSISVKGRGGDVYCQGHKEHFEKGLKKVPKFMRSGFSMEELEVKS